MSTHSKSRRGFSLIEGVLVILFATVFVGGGLYVISKQKADNDTKPTLKDTERTDNTEVSIANNENNELTEGVNQKTYNIEDFTKYKNSVVGFSFSYPKNWGELEQVNNFDGTGGSLLSLDFSGSKNWSDGAITEYPIGVNLNALGGVSSDEGLYYGGYIYRDNKYYTVPKYIDDEVEIPSEKIISITKSGLGNVLLIQTTSIVSPEIQLLVNLPEGSAHHGISMRFHTDSPDENGYEKGKLNASSQKVLEAVASTFAPI